MGSNLVIAALPATDDPVYKVSSEQVPHLTLLFLGDADTNPNTQRIISFVEHAVGVSEHGSFYLDVDYRGKLGPDEADVFFFRKDWSAKWITQFRNQLLQEPNIRTAFDSADQYEEWTPHLTLGYPATPAHEDKMPEYGINMVRFDRIAVWNQDYAGPEFRLEWPERMDDGLAVAYSTIGRSAVAELLHVSEKPWGDYTKADYSLEQWHAACLIHTHEGDPTSKSECKLPVKTPDGTLNRGGVHAAAAALAGARGGVQASDDQKAKAAKALVRYYAQLGEDPPESLVKHSGLSADELVHFGVKGMKWGVRKARSGGGVQSRVPHAFKTDRYGRDRWSPDQHSLSEDLIKAVFLNGTGIGTAVAMPANVRLGKRLLSPQSATERADANWKKGLTSTQKGIAVHNKAASEVNRKLPGFNADKRWKDSQGRKIDLNKNSAKMDAYNRAFEREVMNPAYTRAAIAVHGSKSPGGRYSFTIKDPTTGEMKVIDSHEETPKRVKVSHADMATSNSGDFEVAFTFHILRDTNGSIVGFEWPQDPNSDSMAQSAIFGEIFVEGLLSSDSLAHHGIKGMKWGVHKNRSTPMAVAPHATSRVPAGNKRKTRIKAEGGQNHPAHEDALKVAKSRIKLAKSGPAALSNQELREVANRIQLEQQVRQLTRHGAHKFVRNLLKSQGNQAAQQVVGKQVKRKLATAVLL